ncbi:MAG: DnaJ domain-containing protein [Parcubacteria group bacterium]|nr:DnaJ domain-containing protein [Parcubacteria group bacterium]
MAIEEAERKACGVLGIEYPPSLQAIRTSYRSKAKKVHPDLTGTRDREDEFREVTEAYQLLKNSVSRGETGKKETWKKTEAVKKTMNCLRKNKRQRKKEDVKKEPEKKLPDLYTKRGKPDYWKSEGGESRGRL